MGIYYQFDSLVRDFFYWGDTSLFMTSEIVIYLVAMTLCLFVVALPVVSMFCLFKLFLP